MRRGFQPRGSRRVTKRSSRPFKVLLSSPLDTSVPSTPRFFFAIKHLKLGTSSPSVVVVFLPEYLLALRIPGFLLEGHSTLTKQHNKWEGKPWKKARTTLMIYSRGAVCRRAAGTETNRTRVSIDSSLPTPGPLRSSIEEPRVVRRFCGYRFSPGGWNVSMTRDLKENKKNTAPHFPWYAASVLRHERKQRKLLLWYVMLE